MSTSPSSSSSSPNVFTYRYAGKYVYVTQADTYEQAISDAQRNFEELTAVPIDAITLYVSVTVQGKPETVRIGSNAWLEVTSRLPRYEIIDVKVSSSRCPSPHGLDAPPQYSADVKDPRHLDVKPHPQRASSPNFLERMIGKK